MNPQSQSRIEALVAGDNFGYPKVPNVERQRVSLHRAQRPANVRLLGASGALTPSRLPILDIKPPRLRATILLECGA
jgi:hypothetical protein